MPRVADRDLVLDLELNRDQERCRQEERVLV